MLDGSAAIALGAGTLAALNPCGFALLPAYLSLLVTGEDDPKTSTSVLRALRMTAAMTAGFVLVFAVFGLAVAPFAASAQRHLPWISVFIGVALVAAGLWQLSGRTLALPTLWRRSGPVTTRLSSMFGFGVAYALASLTCTIAPFLAVVVSAFRADDTLSGLVLFALYAAGMGLVVGSAAIAVALAQESLVKRARSLGGVVPKVGAALLVIVGAYVAYYGAWEIRVLGGGDPSDPIIDTALGIQQWLANLVSSMGLTGLVVVLAMLVALGWVSVRRSRAKQGVS